MAHGGERHLSTPPYWHQCTPVTLVLHLHQWRDTCGLPKCHLWTPVFLEWSIHTPQHVSGGEGQAPTLLEGFTMLVQLCLTPGDGHISTPAVCWQLRRWGKSEHGRKSKEKSAQETRFHLRSSQQSLHNPWFTGEETNTGKRINSNCPGKKSSWKKLQAQLRNQGKEQRRLLHWGTRGNDTAPSMWKAKELEQNQPGECETKTGYTEWFRNPP